MRSITSVANGGRPVLPAGACGAISANSSVHAITRFILSKNSRLRVRCDQLESGVGKAYLFHCSTVSDQAITELTFADLP